MATIPVASPSRPSMRFTALVMTMTHNAVSNGVTSGDRTKKPTKGILNWNIVTPRNTSTMAASTCPAILAGADISLTSSMNPTTKITAAPRTNPSGSEDPAKISWSCPSCEATRMATRNARNIAAPPPYGVTRAWTRRSSGSTTSPARMASARIGNMATKVPTAATAATIAYAPRGGTISAAPGWAVP